MKHRLSFVLTLISLLPTLVLAQGLMGSWHEWLNIPSEWATPPNLIYYVFIPFLGTFAIIWGILTATHAKIFQNNRVNIVISFVFAVSLFYFNILPPIVLYLFTFGGLFGVVAFFVLFFVLTFLFGKRKIGVSYRETERAIKDIKKGAEMEKSDILRTSRDLEKVARDLHSLERRKIKTWKDLQEVNRNINNIDNALRPMNPNNPRVKPLNKQKKDFAKKKVVLINQYKPDFYDKI